MAVSLSIALKQSQRLAMTQSLRQSIEMLQLSTIELAETITEELTSNPVLEEEFASSTPDTVSYNDELMQEANRELSGDSSNRETIEENNLKFADVSDAGSYKSYDDDKKQQAIENAFVSRESLADHLTEQIRELGESDDRIDNLMTIATLLDDNGFFTPEHEEFCLANGFDRKELVACLDIVRLLEPVGCATCGVQESLLVQAKATYPDDDLLVEIIEHHFDDLSKLFYDKVAKKTGVPVELVVEKSSLLQTLVPYPGRKYSKKEANYVIPELEVHLIDEEVVLMFYDDWIPKIKINNYYAKMANDKTCDQEIKKYVREKINSAKYLMRSISGRRETIEKVVRAIMEHQMEFLKKGSGFLLPLVHADIASATGFNESTISRVTSNKYVQTSWGIFELKYFFVSKVTGSESEHSSDAVMKLIQDIVSAENPEKPYTDEEIVSRLENAGVSAARRTVAKYRGILHIPSSNKRKRINKLRME